VKQELVKQAAAAAAAAAEQAAKEAAAGGQQEGQVQAGTPNKNKKKRKHESVEAALSPVKVTASEMRNAYYKGRPKKGPTRQQQFNSDYSTFTAEFVRAKENGKKTAKKAQQLETGENAYMLKPVVGQRLEVGFSVCVGGVEKKTLTWVPLAYVIANKQVHPGMKEAAQFARVPSKTIAELEQLDEAGEAYCEAVDQHNAEQSDADSESGSESESESESEALGSAGSSGATWAGATADVMLTRSETDMRCARLASWTDEPSASRGGSMLVGMLRRSASVNHAGFSRFQILKRARTHASTCGRIGRHSSWFL
jgi:hypothetical protein